METWARGKRHSILRTIMRRQKWLPIVGSGREIWIRSGSFKVIGRERKGMFLSKMTFLLESGQD